MAIVSLAEVKDELGKTTSADDAELQDLIDAVGAVVTDYISAPVEPTACIKRVRPWGSALLLSQVPVITVDNVTSWSGVTPTTYTEAADPSEAGTATFIVDNAATGKLVRLGSNGEPTPWDGNVVVEYTAGYASVPPAINIAARKIIANAWKTSQRGPRSANPVSGGQAAPPAALAALRVTAEAAEYLEPFRIARGRA